MIHVIMSTYNPAGAPRGKYAIQTVWSLVENLRAVDTLQLVVADDGSEDDSFIDEITRIADAEWGNYKVSRVDRKGIGGSLNAAIQRCVDEKDQWLYITDDWVLTEELNLSSAQMLIRQGYDYVRLNPLHPDLMCKTRFVQDLGWYLHLFQNCGGFAFATRPFLATRGFYNRVGPFVEKQDAYVTESDYARRVSMCDELQMAALVDMHGPWNHIGEYEVGTLVPNA